jgi:hypothetical protein
MTTQTTSNSSESAPTPPPEAHVGASKEIAPAHVEQIHTNERVPGHPGYYEKDGLRTYGDDEDHDHERPVRVFLS